MNKTKDNGYLFAKMSASSEENDVGHILLGDRRGSKLPSTRAFKIEQETKDNERQTLRKWIADNVMLLVTFVGVIIGVIVGE
jgi:hypothetical protein